MGIAVQSRCVYCNAGIPVGRRHLAEPRGMLHFLSGNRAVLCDNYDSECRHIGEPFGYYVFAWLPKQCRNFKWRWLRWIESHGDGTFTLGDRAH